MKKFIGSRKLLAFIVASSLATLCYICQFQFLTSEMYLNFLKWIFIAYVGTNAASKFGGNNKSTINGIIQSPESLIIEGFKEKDKK